MDFNLDASRHVSLQYRALPAFLNERLVAERCAGHIAVWASTLRKRHPKLSYSRRSRAPLVEAIRAYVCRLHACIHMYETLCCPLAAADTARIRASNACRRWPRP